MSQAVTLNAIFVNLARRAHATKYLEHYEKYLRLGLKAQSQCRAACETLTLMKNPPVFARQANIAQGPQQVNNGIVNNGLTRAGISEPAPNKLLEANGERVDRGPAGDAIKSYPAMEAVGEIDGAADRGRESMRVPERVPRRRTAEGASVRKRA